MHLGSPCTPVVCFRHEGSTVNHVLRILCRQVSALRGCRFLNFAGPHGIRGREHKPRKQPESWASSPWHWGPGGLPPRRPRVPQGWSLLPPPGDCVRMGPSAHFGGLKPSASYLSGPLSWEETPRTPQVQHGTPGLTAPRPTCSPCACRSPE